MPKFINQVFMVITIFSALGLIFIIQSKKIKSISSKIFLITLFLVVGYVISHTIHFMLLPPGDLTVLDKSCQSFLLLIIISLTFFSYYYPYEKKMPILLKGLIFFPSLIMLFMLWTGRLISESHLHSEIFEAHYTFYYILFIVWYLFLIALSSVFLLNKIRKTNNDLVKKQIQLIFIGLIITILTAFIFGIFLPWLLGFYYLVEVSPLAFLSGVILFSTIALQKFNLFRNTREKFQEFSIVKKVIFVALIIVPITILMLQIPIGRLLFDFNNSGSWFKFLLLNIIGGIITSTVMAIFIVRIIARPLIKIKRQIVGIKNGEYGLMVDIKSNDEIGELASTFNEMSLTLKENSEIIKSNNKKIELLLDAFEKSNASIAIIDNSLRIIEVNKMFYRINNISEEEVLNKKINSLPGYSFLSENKIYNYETTINKILNNTSRTFVLSISPFNFNKIKNYGFLIVEVDITTTKELEQKLILSEKLAAIGKMATVLAHEIKTPLTSIKMNCDMLSAELKSDSENSQSFEIINREINRLNNLVKEVLHFSKHEKLELKNIMLKKIIDKIILQNSNKFSKGNFEVVNNIDETILNLDEEKIYRVFLNLIENAFEARRKNGKVILYSKKTNNNLDIYVEDNGVGINEELQQKIFDPFFTNKASGTGLGLAIVKKIIELHNGSIQILSPKNNTILKLTFKGVF